MDHIRQRLLQGVVRLNDESTSVEELKKRGEENLSGGDSGRDTPPAEQPGGNEASHKPVVQAHQTSLEQELAERKRTYSEELERVQWEIEKGIERRAELRRELKAIGMTLEWLAQTSTQPESASRAEEEGVQNAQ